MVGSVHQLPAAWRPDDGRVWKRPRGRWEGSSAAAHTHEICQLILCSYSALHQHTSAQAFPNSGACCGSWWEPSSFWSQDVFLYSKYSFKLPLHNEKLSILVSILYSIVNLIPHSRFRIYEPTGAEKVWVPPLGFQQVLDAFDLVFKPCVCSEGGGTSEGRHSVEASDGRERLFLIKD